MPFQDQEFISGMMRESQFHLIHLQLSPEGPIEDGRHQRVQLGGGLVLQTFEGVVLGLQIVKDESVHFCYRIYYDKVLGG